MSFLQFVAPDSPYKLFDALGSFAFGRLGLGGSSGGCSSHGYGVPTRGKKNFQNSEYSGFSLFGQIEWIPPLKTKKHLRVMRRTGKQPWSIFY